ncbi:MAG: ribosomal-protein-alanine N-acetyltransferase [Erysipelotrichaceae bacterium]|nr:ribosomal-protein-alanine N-acetyltransferase [Erysipelotrichaceae bacterium]MBR3694055.1 ribosomal protein S18-alanine N-acetyltransferase [Erysipelotrichales bacterium]
MGNRTKLRPMTLEDLPQVMVLEQENFSANPWHKEHFEYELEENPFSKMFVLELDNEVIAYYGIWITFEECQITTIAVADAHKGKGYGNVMMESILHEAKEACCERISLEVRVSNERAQNLYRKYGFENISIRKNYYENTEDAYVMMKGI